MRAGRHILYFVEYNAGRLVDPEEPHHGGYHRYQNHDLVIGRWEIKDIVIRDAI